VRVWQNSPVSSPFARVRRSRLGYNVRQVDAFLDRARRAYDGAAGDDSVTAERIRLTAFAMQKGGYSTAHVDAALERLEDAFAAREREDAFEAMGNEAWLVEARTTAQVVLNRLARPEGRRFQRTSRLAVGYSTSEVDRFADKLTRYFRNGQPISVDEVRTVVFRPERGGYREAQVDLVLDAVVDVMLAVR
jgi:DivIVA domain-containing protein